MVSLPDKDAIVIGAGAAGLAAGRRLVEAGLDIVILEARDRIGGRAWTVDSGHGFPLDMGCEWLHNADVNPLVPVARGLGFEVDEHPEVWSQRTNRIRLGPEGYAEFDRAQQAFWDGVEACGAADRDVAAADLIDPDHPWRPWLDSALGRIAGAGLDAVSALDLARIDENDVNWRLPAGYGAVIARYGTGLPVRLETAVEAVGLRGRAVTIEGPWGRLSARAVVLAVPASLIAAETVRFDPPLPAEKLQAAADLPLGEDAKVFLAVTGKPFGRQQDMQYCGRFDSEVSGNYQIHPFGRPLATGFLGGAFAGALEREGPEALAAFAIDELAHVFGEAVRSHLCLLRTSAWMSDPWSRGAYSYARPGKADARKVLAAPVDGRLFFAGEACSVSDAASCHGAYQTGRAAADAVLERLRLPV